MEEALIALLAGVAGGRRYWTRAPQKTQLPFVVLNRVDALRDYVQAGPSRYVSSRVQADVYAATYTALQQEVRAIVGALSGYKGSVGGQAIFAIFIDAQRDLPAADAGDVATLFRTSLDLIIHYPE